MFINTDLSPILEESILSSFKQRSGLALRRITSCCDRNDPVNLNIRQKHTGMLYQVCISLQNRKILLEELILCTNAEDNKIMYNILTIDILSLIYGYFILAISLLPNCLTVHVPVGGVPVGNCFIKEFIMLFISCRMKYPICCQSLRVSWTKLQLTKLMMQSDRVWSS